MIGALNRTAPRTALGIVDSSGVTLPFGSCPDTSLLAVVGGNIVGLSPTTTGDFARWRGTAWAMTCGAKDYQTSNVVEAAIKNTTAATSGATKQYSGILELSGTGHDADADASVTERWGFQVRPVNGNTVYSNIYLLYAQDAAAWSGLFRWQNDGTFACSQLIVSSYQQFGTYGYIYAAHAAGCGVPSGLEIKQNTNAPIVMHVSALTDAANAVGIYAGIDNAAGTWTNAATIRLLSLGTGKRDATATWTELASARADGSLYGVSMRATGNLGGVASTVTFTNTVEASAGAATGNYLVIYDGTTKLKLALLADS